MKKNELVALLQNLSEDDSIDEILKGNETLIKLFEKKLTLDDVKNFIDTNDDGKQYLQSYGDKRVTEGINTWKEKNLQTIINDEVLKATGKKKTPEQIKIEELEKQFKEQKAKADRAENIAKYKDVLSEKNIPMEMIDYFLTDNDETTNKRIDNFTTYVNSMVDDIVKEKLADATYVPPGENGTGELTAEDLAKMMM